MSHTLTSRLRSRAAVLALAVGLAVAAPIVTAPAPAQAATVSCTISATKTVRQGDSGSCVRLLQQRLGGLVVDGSFGPATHKAVLFFQRSRGLVADGIVGPITWSALKSGLTKYGSAIYSYNNITVFACRNSANTGVKYAVNNKTSVNLRQVTLWRAANSTGTYVDYINIGKTVQGGYYQATGATEKFRSLTATHLSTGKKSTLTTSYGFQRGTLPVCR